MGEICGYIIEGVGHVLVGLFDWIPKARYDSIDRAWVWPIALCLIVGFVALVAALWLGHPWLYRLVIGAFVVSFAFVIVGALCSRPRRNG